MSPNMKTGGTITCWVRAIAQLRGEVINEFRAMVE
jgi:hypothetical protein